MVADAGRRSGVAVLPRRGLVTVLVVLLVAATGLTAAAYARHTAPATALGPPTTVVAAAGEGPAPVVAFLGDSYTAGAGASTAARRWTTVLSEEQGWIEENHGEAGTGYARDGGDPGRPAFGGRVAAVVAAAPDVVFVSGGRDDDTSTSAYVAATEQVFADLRAELPDTQLVATSPVWDARRPPDELAELAEAVRSAVEAAGGDYLDLGQPLQGHPERLAEDGVNANDLGHAAIAAEVSSLLE